MGQIKWGKLWKGLWWKGDKVEDIIIKKTGCREPVFFIVGKTEINTRRSEPVCC